MLHGNTKASKIEAYDDRKRRFYNFLAENPIGVLSTVTPNADPHGVVIYFDVNEDLVCSFITRAETRKNDNLKHNNHAMLTVFEPATQAVIQIFGIALAIEDSYDINETAKKTLGASLKTSQGGLPPIAKLQAGPFVGYRIIPKQIRMAVYARPDSGEYSELFESLESYELELSNT